MRRKKLIAGNWKMHMNTQQASVLVHRLQERVKSHRDVEVVLIPGFLHLQPIMRQMDHRKFKIGAQNCHFEDEGTFTGEVSATQLKNLVHYVLAGHSERRNTFGETDAIIARKVAAIVRNGMRVILCVGETAQDRADGHTKTVLHDQVVAGLSQITTHEMQHVVVAYEPVWAISGGSDFGSHKIPTHEEIKEAVDTIRLNVRELYGKKAEEQMRVIYGGSSNPDNLSGIMDIEGVDGALPGGASLNYMQFSQMTHIAHDKAVEQKAK
jgi:triosephosphate isomerase